MRQAAKARPPRATYLAPEIAIQQGIIDALRVCADPKKVKYYHCPNEGERDAGYAYRLKRMGVLAGVPDLTFHLAGGRTGFIEIKSDVGKLSQAQKAFRDDVRALGCYWEVAFSITDALRTLEEWGCLREGVRP